MPDRQRPEDGGRPLPRSRIYNYPVVPEEGEHYLACSVKPVTRAEMKCDFRNFLHYHSFRGKAIEQLVFDYGMASSIGYHWRRQIMDVETGRERPGWREELTRLSERGVYLWGINSWAIDRVDPLILSDLQSIFGARFFGFNEGEWDGAYTSMHGVIYSSGGMQPPSPSRTRRQAREHYDRYLCDVYRRHGDRMVGCHSMGFGCHYAAERECRMMGIEISENIPSSILLWAFCRGASRQYDLLTASFPALCCAYGIRAYYRDGKFDFDPGTSGPQARPTLGLMKRLWYLSYMYGASIIGTSGHLAFFQTQTGGHACFEEPPTQARFEANLSPIGWLQWEFMKFARRHPMRGVSYNPIALLLDEDHGWNPPFNPYRAASGQCDQIWGNLPYARGDYQIDNFFRWVYPGYQDGSFFRDEHGYITNTPFGDSFDVILSNASPRCLSKYRAAVLLGDIRVEEREGLAERLTGFLEGGGGKRRRGCGVGSGRARRGGFPRSGRTGCSPPGTG